MMRKYWLSVLVLMGCGSAWGQSPGPVRYNRDIRPILSDNCLSCHGPDSANRKADLRLDTPAGLFEGEAPVVVKGKPEQSELIARINAGGRGLMPPPKSHKKLTPEQKSLLTRWIAEGAVWEPHWSLVKPARPALPEVKKKDWVRNPIDRFILAQLETLGLEPRAEADRRTLIRRVTFDLTGLPPTPAEVEAFVKDSAPDAYEKVVDRLLASKHYGEHRARFWLDAARYADTHGLHVDNYREMWPYRDWVIEAFNSNLSFDRFTLEQLAGDLLPEPTLDQLVATGFHRCNITTNEGGSIPDEVAEIYAKDRVETTATVWLGLTAGCSACHHHKFDPLTTQDFYSLTAFFKNTTQNPMDGNIPDTPPILKVPQGKDRDRWFTLQQLSLSLKEQQTQRRDSILKGYQQWLADQGILVKGELPFLLRYGLLRRDGEYQQIRVQIIEMEKEQAAIRARSPVTHVMQERKGSEPVARVLFRGAYDQPRETVKPAAPHALSAWPKKAPTNRLGLAMWILEDDNPLTARVTVNRMWQELFGAGIVRTSEDFGIMGEPPTHPELLDWLAVEFRETGWDVKRFYKLLATSAVYRQSAAITPDSLKKDPQNRYLSRGPRFRMDGETLRDFALASSGLLARKIGGPSVKPYQPPGVWEAVAMHGSNTRFYKEDRGEGLYRRSLYTFWKRSAPPAMLEIFNAPSRENCAVRRERTNTPLQALVTMNDVQFVEAARYLAQRSLLEGGKDFDARLDFLSMHLLSRTFEPRERQVCKAVLEDFLKHYQGKTKEAERLIRFGETRPEPSLAAPELAAWTMLANQVMNLDEALNK